MPPTRVPHSFAVLALLLLVSGVYLPGLFGDFVSDDWPMIAENERLDHGSFLSSAFSRSVWENSNVQTRTKNIYRPLYLSWYYAQNAAFGKNPLAFHTMHLLLHLLNVLLVLRVFRSLFPDSDFSLRYVATAFFALHPVNVEAIAWISGGTDLLMTFFLLLGMLAAIRHLNAGGGVSCLATLACFAAALLTKETAIVFPLLVAAAHFLVLRCAPARGGFLYAGLASLAVIFLAVRQFILVDPGQGSPFSLTNDGVVRLIEYASLAARYLTIPWPQPFYLAYPHSGMAQPWEFVWGGAVWIGALIWFTRSPTCRFPIVWCVLTLAPPLGLAFHDYGTFALRFLYPATIMAGLLFAQAWQRLPLSLPHARWAVGGAVTILACATVVAAVPGFRDEGSFNRKILRYDPTQAGAYFSLARHQIRNAEPQAALATYRTALERVVNPQHRLSLLESLALLQAKLQQHRQSIATYGLLVEHESTRALGLTGIANNLWMLGEREQALDHYARALAAAPEDFDTRYNYALLLEQTGNIPQAAAEYRRLLRLPRPRGRDAALAHAQMFLRRQAHPQ